MSTPLGLEDDAGQSVSLKSVRAKTELTGRYSATCFI